MPVSYRILKDDTGRFYAQKLNELDQRWVFFHDLSESADIQEAMDELRVVIRRSKFHVVAMLDEDGNEIKQ